MNEKFVLGVDLDDVVAKYLEGFRSVFLEIYKKDPESVGTVENWDFSDWGLDRDAFLRLHRFAVEERQLYLNLEVEEGAKEALWKLSDAGILIRVITNRLLIPGGHSFAAGDTVRWLEAAEIPYWDLCFIKDKTSVKADLYIDDAPHNIEAFLQMGSQVLIYDQPYNRYIKGERIHNWEEATEVVLAHRAKAERDVSESKNFQSNSHLKL
jgi:5'(3')-deoxyribonucleotidase